MNEPGTCGCCEGTEILTPLPTANRPGLPQISYRVGTHATFLETMMARLSGLYLESPVNLPDDQGQRKFRGFYPLEPLTTRDPGDPAVALLDAWAAVADVLTFYQERIANEGYLRTATERRSILELARLIGYKLRPGVASSVYLAYTLDEDRSETPPKPMAVTIPAGSRAESIPGPGELPQSFETSDDLEASSEWNNLQVRLTQPQLITLENAQEITKLYFAGTSLRLKSNDRLLLVFGDEAGEQVMRTVQEVTAQFDEKRTEVTLQTVPFLVIAAVRLLRMREGIENLLLGNYPPIEAAHFSHDRIYDFLRSSELPFIFPPTENSQMLKVTKGMLNELVVMIQNEGFQRKLVCFASSVIRAVCPVGNEDRNTILEFLKSQVAPIKRAIEQWKELGVDEDWLRKFEPLFRFKELNDSLTKLLSDVFNIASDLGSRDEIATFLENKLAQLRAFDANLSAECKPSVQVADVGTLIKSLAMAPSSQPVSSAQLDRSTSTALAKGADTVPQLLTTFQPRLLETFYDAWSNAAVNPTSSTLKSVHVLRLVAQPFGYNAQVKMGLKKNYDERTMKDLPFIAEPDGDWEPGKSGDELEDRLYLDAAYDGIQSPGYLVIQRGSTSMAAIVEEALVRPRTAYGLSARTTQLALSRAWWAPDTDSMNFLRNTTVFAQSEELSLADAPYASDVGGDRIELEYLYDGLESGRWLIVSGERTDVEGTTGVKASELVMLSGSEQLFNSALPGDKTRTVISIKNKLAYQYKRETVTICGNVVKATHGETRNEVLGSGDGSKSLQRFTLKQPPLTFVAAANPDGVDSTLVVRVNDVQWHEAESLAGLSPTNRAFITKTDDDGKTSLVFGNGERGARLPTGQENVTAVYRSGIGKMGNAKAGQISLLVSRPLGVKEVINPLPATGGADKENRDQARENAPLAVMALDRLVSTRDYADFARTFAGIGKASAARLSDGHRQLVRVTIAGAEDIPIAETSDLYRNLVRALHDFGEPHLPIKVELRELKLLSIHARVRVLPDYLWEKVEPKVRAALLEAFSFERRALGQDALLSEAMSAIQAVKGVAYTDVEVFDALDETQVIDSLANGSSLADALTRKRRVPVAMAQTDLAEDDADKRILPAELAYFTPDVPDTIILTEISE